MGSAETPMKTNTMTIKDVGEVIARMMEVEALAGHAATLVGPRTRGSTTAAGLDCLPPDTLGEEFTPEAGAIPGCRYFAFGVTPDSELDPRKGAVSLLEALELRLPVCVRQGAHGPELYVDRELKDLPTTDTVTVILGPDETGSMEEVVWTWHPGPPLGSCSRGLNDFTGVKIHNG